MWCVLHKVSDDFYRAYTNVIFDTKDNADFFAKKSKFKKKMIAEWSNMIINILQE